MIILMVIIILALAIAGFLFDAFLLNLTTKLFGAENTNYKTALKVSILVWLSSVLASIVLLIIKLQNLSNLLSVIIGFIIFHKLLQKSYNTSLKKNVGIYIAYLVFTVAITLAIVIPIRMLIVQPFYMKGASMEPSLRDNDYFLINEFSRSYNRGDIVVIQYPNDIQQHLVKRIIALPGEQVQIKDGEVIIFNGENPHGFKLQENYLDQSTKTYGLDENIVKLKADEYYVLGDHRIASKDSRLFGPLNKSYITGKYWVKLLTF